MFDKLSDFHRVQKVETAGDCYIVAGGILDGDGDGMGFFQLQEGAGDPVVSASRVFAFAQDMLRCSLEVRSQGN